MENLIQFVPGELLILIASIYVLGIFLKKIERVKDNYITAFLMVFAISFSLVLVGFNANAILQGILCWGSAVGVNQLKVQANKVE
ncbi:MAG: phage holin family protein [Clostridium sp.]